MTSKVIIAQILDEVQTSNIDWNFMCTLKHDLEELVETAQAEGADRLLDEINHLAGMKRNSNSIND